MRFAPHIFLVRAIRRVLGASRCRFDTTDRRRNSSLRPMVRFVVADRPFDESSNRARTADEGRSTQFENARRSILPLCQVRKAYRIFPTKQTEKTSLCANAFIYQLRAGDGCGNESLTYCIAMVCARGNRVWKPLPIVRKDKRRGRCFNTFAPCSFAAIPFTRYKRNPVVRSRAPATIH